MLHDPQASNNWVNNPRQNEMVPTGMTCASLRVSFERVSKELFFVVSAQANGLRLDQAIAQELAAVSRTRARSLLALGGVFVDGKRTKVAGRRVREGQRVKVVIGQETLALSTGEPVPMAIPIVTESEDFLIVDKPSGVFSAPTPETDRNDLLYFLKVQLPTLSALHLVHRLDRPTSGLMVLGKSREAAAHLSRQVAAHTMGRKYLAMVAGVVREAVRVDQEIAGKPAVTHFRPLGQKGSIALVEAELETGRTHQVRLHAVAIGHPVLGDSKYGRRALRAHPSPGRLALHAHLLQMLDPRSERALSFSSDFPKSLSDFWTSLPT